MSQSAESLIEERVQQLQEISKRRNELLREMYHLIQKRDNLGSVIAVEDDGEENLQLFLDRFDLEKHPDTGLIENLQEEEVALPVTPPAYSPVTGPVTVQQNVDQDQDVSELPVPPSPAPAPEPQPHSQDATSEETQPDVQPPKDVDMEVDEVAADGHSPQPEAPASSHDVASKTVSRETTPVEDNKPTGGLADGSAEQPEAYRQRTPQLKADTPPLVDASLESPMPQSVDHSSTVSYTEASVTREPSSARVSPPRAQRSPSPASPPSHVQEDVVKVEPQEDEAMEVTENPPTTQEQRPRPGTKSPTVQELSLQSEDHIMDILGPTQIASSPARASENRQHVIDYSIPRPPAEPSVDFAFESGVAEGLADVDVTPFEPFGPEPPYPLPPLSLLPIEFSRRGKPSKRERKKEKEKEKDKGEAKKEEWQPMSLNKWAAVLRANPVHKKMSRATKCLSTRDWSVGMAELRLIRTFERIELLKDAGRWSFRQIKKQRGVGGLTKTHWDYLLDEMKWMRTDFREERRWKLALAYTLAHAVMEWHEAGSLEERLRRGICVLWKPPPHEDTEMAEASEPEGPFRDSQEGDETGGDSRETGTPMNDYGSDDESEDDQDKEQQDVIDALEPGSALQDALEQLEEHAQASQSQAGTQDVTIKPKLEEIEDLTALGDSSQSRDENAMQVDGPQAETANGTKPEEPKEAKPAAPESESHPALKATSKDPILGKPVSDGDGAHGKSKNKASQYAPLRDHIVYSQVDKLFLDLDDLDIVKGMSDLTTDDFSPTAPPPPADLSSIFPDLQPYGMLDVAPTPSATDGRKKSDRRGDKDDPNKRADDATYSKLVVTSKFMQVKPTLVGTLKPANNWKDGKWKRIEETPVFADIDVPPARPIEENLCALFEGGKASGSGMHPGVLNIGRDGRKRTADLVWTPAEDTLLKQMVEKYPGNWVLIAEAFNSSRVTIPTDRRTPVDCWDRWNALLSGANAGEDGGRPSTPAAAAAAAASHMTTRGHKRTASQSVAASGSSSGGSMATEPKKRVRHNLMYDTLRKAAKRREAVQKSNAAPRTKASQVHETHGQVTKMQRLTPAELSRLKAEKEARDAQELNLRRRNDELARQHLLREQAQRAQGLPPNATPQTPLVPQAAAANGVPRPPSGVPQPQMVQQIRSQVGISQQQQQQRIAAALANTRMSPPQLAAAHFRAMQGQPSGAAPGQAGAQGSGQMPQPSAASAALSAAAPALSAAHLSPSFAARTASSSPGLPQQSPPLPAASPANAGVARPPSVPGQPVHGVSMASSMLQAQNMAQQYYLQMQQRGGLTPEQLQAIMAQVQAQQQHQRQAQQHQQYAAHAQQAQQQQAQQQQQQQQQPQAGQQGQGQQGSGYQHS
ncbi:hypothetical protein C8Q77DRAFT_1094591 [Trametes polyzona]|nr:hypothetical protein C8Q77DRAFT_1094591 [Trametes polyzona]